MRPRRNRGIENETEGTEGTEGSPKPTVRLTVRLVRRLRFGTGFRATSQPFGSFWMKSCHRVQMSLAEH